MHPPPILVRSRAPRRSACRGLASPKRCATIRASAVRTTPSTSASSRSAAARRSEEHTSELPSLMRNSYAGFFLEKKKQEQNQMFDESTENKSIQQNNHAISNNTKLQINSSIHPIIESIHKHNNHTPTHKLTNRHNTPT